MKRAYFTSWLAAGLSLAVSLTPAADTRADDPAHLQQGPTRSAITLPVPEIETLPNGLTLVWFLNDNLPIVDLALLVKAGYRDDPVGKSGTAELVAATLDRGAAGMNAQAIGRSVERLGGSRYVSSDEDTFSVGMHGLAGDAATYLDLLGKIALKPDFPEADVKREHERILDRWSHVADYGETLVALAYDRLLASGTSYGRGSLQSAKQFANVGRADVVDFHKRYFTPGNSVLMIVGRVNKAELKAKIQASFGAWTGTTPKREYRNFTDAKLKSVPGEVLLVDRASLTQAQVRLGFRAPLISSPDHYSLVVANALLGEYFNSRLNALIRDKLALTYGISSAFSYSRDLGTFTISSATRNESVGQLIHKTEDVLRDLKRGPIPSAEVEMAKDYLRGGFPLSTATLGSVAARWLAGYVFDLGPQYLNEFVPKVTAVTPEAVLQAVAKDFDLNHMTIVVAGDADEVGKSLAQAKFKRVRKVSAKELF